MKKMGAEVREVECTLGGYSMGWGKLGILRNRQCLLWAYCHGLDLPNAPSLSKLLTLDWDWAPGPEEVAQSSGKSRE